MGWDYQQQHWTARSSPGSDFASPRIPRLETLEGFEVVIVKLSPFVVCWPYFWYMTIFLWLWIVIQRKTMKVTFIYSPWLWCAREHCLVTRAHTDRSFLINVPDDNRMISNQTRINLICLLPPDFSRWQFSSGAPTVPPLFLPVLDECRVLWSTRLVSHLHKTN